MTVLILDNHQDDLKALQPTLQRVWPEIHWIAAPDAETLLAHSRTESPDVIMLDLAASPDRQTRLCRQLKADPLLQHPCVIFLTDPATSRENRIAALDAGAEAFLRRRFDEVECGAQIRAIARLRFTCGLADELDKSVCAQTLQLRGIFDHMADAYCLGEIVYQDDGPVDYHILDVNPAYESILDVRGGKAIGALASQVHGRGGTPFVDVYAYLAETGDSADFQSYFAASQKHLHVRAWSPAKGRFSAVISDVTDAHSGHHSRLQQHHGRHPAPLPDDGPFSSLGRR